MHPVDTLLIDFNPRQMVILNVAMAFLMFSVALDVRLADFRKVVDFPRSVGAGLVAQYGVSRAMRPERPGAPASASTTAASRPSRLNGLVIRRWPGPVWPRS